MSELLERRYTRLLRWYPPADRARLSDELLDTLLESAEPGRTRPSVRESAALVLGGLRARAGAAGPRPVRETWAQGLQLTLVMALLVMVMRFGLAFEYAPRSQLAAATLAAGAAVLVFRGRYTAAVLPILIVTHLPAASFPVSGLRLAILVALSVVAFAGVALRRFAVAGPVLVAAIAVRLMVDNGSKGVELLLLALGVAALATVLRPAQARRSVRWVVPVLLSTVVVSFVTLVDAFGPRDAPQSLYHGASLVACAGFPLAAVVWAAVDPRLATAAVWWSVVITTMGLAPLYYHEHWTPGAVAFIFVIALQLVVLAPVGIWRSRRLAQL